MALVGHEDVSVFFCLPPLFYRDFKGLSSPFIKWRPDAEAYSDINQDNGSPIDVDLAGSSER